MLADLLLAWVCAAGQDPDSLIKSGISKLEKQDFQGALKDFDQAIAAAPDRAEAHACRGIARTGLHSLTDAEKDFNRAIDLDPALKEAYFWRGKVRSSRGAHDLAMQDFASCRELGLRDASVFTWNASSLAHLGRYAEAEAEYGRALELGPRTAEAWVGRAWSRMAQLNLRGTISDATRAIEIDASLQAAYEYRSMAYFGEHSWDNAQRDLLKLAELQGSLSDGGAHWMFLSRCRKGEKAAALQALKEHLKSSTRKSSRWARHILAFDAGEITEAEFLETAAVETKPNAATDKVGVAHFNLGMKRLLAGTIEGALGHFQLASAKLKGSSGSESVLARVELIDEQRRSKRVLIEDLEAKVRALKPFEARFELDLAGKNDEDEDVQTFTWSVDLSREEVYLVVRGRNRKTSKEFSIFFHLKDALGYIWSEGRGENDLYMKMDLTFVRDVSGFFGEEVRRLLPPDAARNADEAKPGVALALNLEGKPSKTERGTMKFSLGLGSHPASWLQEPSSADEATVREEEGTVVFDLPSKRKTIVVDRKTGFLRTLEALDYDGTRRAFKLLSFKPLVEFPRVSPRPEKLKPTPFDIAHFRSQILQQESWLNAELKTAFENWDRIVKAGKEKEVAGLFTRWGARTTDGLHAYGVRTLAGRRIQQALDQGTPAAELLRSFPEESARFAKEFAGERKVVSEFLQGQLEELVYRMETGLLEDLIDSRLHETIRRTLRAAFDPKVVETLRHDTYGDRLESLFREELELRTKL